MGGFFSRESGEGSQKDSDVSFDAAATSGTASTTDDPVAASLAEAPVPARQDGVRALARVAQRALGASSDVAPAESSQSL